LDSPSEELPLIARSALHPERLAIVAPEGRFTYGELLDASAAVARGLLEGREDLAQGRVAYLVPPGFQNAAVQWGIWRAGGMAVPLAVSHPKEELRYVLEDADPTAAVVHPEFEDRIADLAQAQRLRLHRTTELMGAKAGGADPTGPARSTSLPPIGLDRRALMLYTSGTTGRPKGVVTTHRNLEAQVRSLIEAWGWSPEDHILLVLPLHHVHGIVNVLTCALWAGGCCQILPGFEPEGCWERIERADLTLFMAVPTVYAKLLASWDGASPEARKARSEGCRRMRLMVSGSAALPVTLLERWQEVSGHTLLERYGMTEIGMALSNPLVGTRSPGFVGRPLPGVEVRLVSEEGAEVPPGTPGEIEVRGPGVFLEYWRRPKETEDAFREGWFRTGDVAVVEEGDYRILGRRSVDIIKTGGYKVSALEVEEVLRTHPAILECAVVSVPDPEWGERVGAALVPRSAEEIDTRQLRGWMKERLAPYKAPSVFLTLPELPRNAMGKVTKPEVAKLFPDAGG
jgi:malonyl-CoA/methylmalonyl-CoA synthetase